MKKDEQSIFFVYQKMRMKLWANAWSATASSNNCVDSATCTRFADKALEDFDIRFKREYSQAVGGGKGD